MNDAKPDRDCLALFAMREVLTDAITVIVSSYLFVSVYTIIVVNVLQLYDHISHMLFVNVLYTFSSSHQLCIFFKGLFVRTTCFNPLLTLIRLSNRKLCDK